jgi:hypothetical protein
MVKEIGRFALGKIRIKNKREANFDESSTEIERRVKDDNYRTKTI